MYKKKEENHASCSTYHPIKEKSVGGGTINTPTGINSVSADLNFKYRHRFGILMRFFPSYSPFPFVAFAAHTIAIWVIFFFIVSENRASFPFRIICCALFFWNFFSVLGLGPFLFIFLPPSTRSRSIVPHCKVEFKTFFSFEKVRGKLQVRWIVETNRMNYNFSEVLILTPMLV